jgi:hypothetical protein
MHVEKNCVVVHCGAVDKVINLNQKGPGSIPDKIITLYVVWGATKLYLSSVAYLDGLQLFDLFLLKYTKLGALFLSLI